MLLDSLPNVRCDSHIKRTVFASDHVAEPGSVCHFVSNLCTDDPSAPPRSRASLGMTTLIGSSFHFFVPRVLAARIAKLFRLQALGVLLFVLRRRVVAVFAIAALQRDSFPHQSATSVPLSSGLSDLCLERQTRLSQQRSNKIKKPLNSLCSAPIIGKPLWQPPTIFGAEE